MSVKVRLNLNISIKIGSNLTNVFIVSFAEFRLVADVTSFGAVFLESKEFVLFFQKYFKVSDMNTLVDSL